MTGLPVSLSIALWITGSIWLVALVAWLTDAPDELVWGTFGFGVAAGFAEWLARKETRR